jgi:predicted transcriptional regulator of viral defense system
MYGMKLEDKVLRELHRAALDAGRHALAVPSVDLDVVAARTGSREAAQKAIQRLVQAGRVVRVRKDLLVLPDTAGLLGVDLVDLVDAITPRPYLITGGRALEHHELTDQHFFGVVVLTPGSLRTLSFRAQSATFLRTDPANIWGWQDDARPRYALPERAIVDVLNHPRYGVSLTQSLDALFLAAGKYPAFLDRLLETVAHYNSPAVARRVGLVVERLFGTAHAEPYRGLVGANRAPVRLRARGTANGPLDTTWRVVVNAAIEPERVPA